MKWRILSLIALLYWHIGAVIAKEIYIETGASDELINSCKDLIISNEVRRQISHGLETLDGEILSCLNTIPTCDKMDDLNKKRVLYTNIERLERAKAQLLRETPFSVPIDVAPPEVLMLFGASFLSEFGVGQPAEVLISGQDNLFRKEIKFIEGQVYNLIEGIDLQMLVNRRLGVDDLSYPCLEEFQNPDMEPLHKKNYRTSRAAEGYEKIREGRIISLRGNIKTICELGDNQNGEILRIRLPEMTASLNGVAFNGLSANFVFSMRAPSGGYPRYRWDWFASIEPILDRIFNKNPPTSEDIISISKCSNEMRGGLFGVITEMRLAARQNGYLGDALAAFGRSRRKIGIQYCDLPPHVRYLMEFQVGNRGIVLTLDEKRRFMIAGYLEGKSESRCPWTSAVGQP